MDNPFPVRDIAMVIEVLYWAKVVAADGKIAAVTGMAVISSSTIMKLFQA